MIAFSTDSESAIISMIEIAQSSHDAPVPKTAVANVEKMVRDAAQVVARKREVAGALIRLAKEQAKYEAPTIRRQAERKRSASARLAGWLRDGYHQVPFIDGFEAWERNPR